MTTAPAPLFASRLFPTPRPRATDPTAPTKDLLEHLGLVGRTDTTGVHTLLPLGLRVRDQLDRITRDAFERNGFNSLALPTLQSRTLWEESGRWKVYTAEGALVTTRVGGADMCLAPTSEEMATATVRSHLRSHRDLPVRLTLNTTKFRDELSPRGGLMRGREFTMADAYTFDPDRAGMLESVRLLNRACTDALTGIGLHGVFQAPADGGAISAGPTTEHLVLADFGQSSILACDHCGHRGDGTVLTAAFPRTAPRGEPVVNVIVFAVTGPDDATRPTAVCIRSDLTISVRKLTAALGSGHHVELLDPDELPALLGKAAGTLTPWDCTGIDVLHDHSVTHLERFTIADGPDGLRTGASWTGATGLAPLALYPADVHTAADGLDCGRCSAGRYRATEAVEVAHVFELGTQYSGKMHLTFTDDNGIQRTPYMGCSGIGLTRCIQTLAGIHRDANGLRWKPGTGPADVHLVVLRSDQAEQQERTDRTARRLQQLGLRLLIDDRPLPAGEKFHYAQALGVPTALVLSPQRADGELEAIDRWTGRRSTITSDQLHTLLRSAA
ncbi:MULTISPECIES: aminoacyl--tRNA ligase-related protein [Kitasatospora]|uniref:Proline--tRNA ligase n=1 Tax=Kitasatospora setae (strain ATCC 33774 / DSM 43861 / JCM 3304 / KCC A-0304 / NBRC 14216 / KM-6054) TaxID=452652 RepID=E4N5C2_KITSK|nr:aminoacyl--tRNA ligase-related protein [Kitasatospora setae]BAJ26403.1 putative prolyl-tRNA synthetase [Kitasatospora setae KM-6054]